MTATFKISVRSYNSTIMMGIPELLSRESAENITIVAQAANPATMPSYAGFFTRFSSHGSAAPWPENVLGTHEYYPLHAASASQHTPHKRRRGRTLSV